MLGLLVADYIEGTRLQRYHRLKASGPYARNSSGTCPDCLNKWAHADNCPRLLQIAGFHCNFRVYPSIELADQCAPTRTQMRDAQRLHDPFLRFPPELSSRILWHSLDNPSTIMQTAACRGRSYFGPIDLALVCQRWYELAFSEPQLWSTLAIIVDRSMPVDAVHAVEACLERSGGVPLSIMFTAWDPCLSPELITSCIVAICGHTTRWNDVTLNVHRMLLQQFGSASRPQLAHQHLHIQTHSEDEPFPTDGTVGNTALRPTRFVYSERGQVYRGGVVRLPILWNNVRFLDLSGMTAHDLLHLLHSCPRIEALLVTLRDSAAGDDLSKPVVPPLRLKYLITLNLTNASSRPSMTRFFCQISAPHVTTLAVMNRTMTDNEYIPLDIITAFLQRSGNPQLTSLYITGPFCGSKLVHLLKFTPTLVTLNIANSPFGRSAISNEFWIELAAVDISSGFSQFLPQLVTFYYVGPLTFRWNLVVNACDARMVRPWSPKSDSHYRTITSLVIRNHDGFTPGPASLLDKTSLQRFLELPKSCLDISNICLAIDPVLLEYSMEKHGLAAEHDVGLYYSLPEFLKPYYS